jgi:hypothetical protein
MSLYYRMIQSYSTIIMEVVGEVIWSENVNEVFAHSPPFPSYVFFIGVAFIIVTVDFYKVETIRFNIICQLSSLFAIKERNSALCSIFNHCFVVLLLVPFCVVGSGQTCYRYCPNLLSALELSVLSRTLTASTESRLNGGNYKEEHQFKSVVTHR